MINTVDMRGGIDEKFIAGLRERGQRDMQKAVEAASDIIRKVREEGDKAVFELTKKFDGADIQKSGLQVSAVEIEEAYAQVDAELLEVIRKASANIKDFHSKQLKQSWLYEGKDGVVLGQRVTPLESVGVYVPGGTAPLISSVLMNVIPAAVAGVENIILLTPPGRDGLINQAIIVAAVESGAKNIYKAGGAQAIAAMAYGTETIPAVDKITGPGNIYVAAAKKLVYGVVGIDMVAGPSEILVIGDEAAKPAFIAADMLSQAEHDTLAAALLVTDSAGLGEEVIKEIGRQFNLLDRKDILIKSLRDNCAVILASSLEDAVSISNAIAPEHLELCVADPYKLLGKVKNAGAVFLGSYSPEPVGDYFAGPNHVLPTGGSAKFGSPLGVYDFMKRSSVISYTKDALESSGGDIARFAKAEGLTAHANAIKIRLEAGGLK